MSSNHDFDKHFWEKLEELYKKQSSSTKTFENERAVLGKVLEELKKEIGDIYDFIEPVGIGGGGIIISLKDTRLDLERALKIPRPTEKKDLIDTVKNEIEHLKKLRHENLINLYGLGELNISSFHSPYPYFIMEYIKDAKDVRKKTLDLLENVNDNKGLKEATRWIAERFLKIAEAVKFLHKNEIIHFDIKPSNILIDINDKPILSDLGFAKKKIDQENSIVIGFTFFYAHPDLKHEYFHMSDKDRVRKEITPKNFKHTWDIYAFGKSLLEVLNLVDQKFPDVVSYDYIFTYLHLAACRMLDGRNLSQTDTERIRTAQIQKGDDITVYKETWLDLDSGDLEQIKYKNFEEITEDFGKILKSEHFLESVPELNAFFPKRVQSSHGIPAPFTQRVRYVIEHPVFSRLTSVLQLGLTNYIYPTATHNRLQHSIGSFRNCCLYVESLYNDPYNPLFKQLVNEEDVRSILLASLLHDIGQYPLAHELGEIEKRFKHENFNSDWLDNPSEDKFGHTLKEIIENSEYGWGVGVDKIKELISQSKQQQEIVPMESLKSKMLSSILDGPIDVDKLDYLLRDSRNCYLKYGELIDIDRLIRNITIIVFKDARSQKIFTVGTYEKGKSAAESVTFARYLLYQSLYWHHTARSIRSMLRESMKSISYSETGKGKSKNIFREFSKLIGVKGNPRYLTTDDVLDFIGNFVDEDGKRIIEMIKQRNYYKRILTIHSEPEPEEGKVSFLERFRKIFERAEFQENLQSKIRTKFEDYVSHTESPKVSLLNPEQVNKVLEILDTPKKIICDCPGPSYGTDDKLRFVPEPQRLRRNYYARYKAGERVSEVWNQIYFKLMNIASKGRVFCHPDIRDTLMAAVGPGGIEECLMDTIQQFEH